MNMEGELQAAKKAAKSTFHIQNLGSFHCSRWYQSLDGPHLLNFFGHISQDEN